MPNRISRGGATGAVNTRTFQPPNLFNFGRRRDNLECSTTPRGNRVEATPEIQPYSKVCYNRSSIPRSLYNIYYFSVPAEGRINLRRAGDNFECSGYPPPPTTRLALRELNRATRFLIRWGYMKKG